MATCKECLHVAVCGRYAATGGRVRDCEHFAGKEVITNADRIRAMTDEELAFAIICPRDMGADIATCALTCMECCLQWLHQPAKEE